MTVSDDIDVPAAVGRGCSGFSPLVGMDRRKAIYQNDKDRADRLISITNIRLISVTERTCNLGLRIVVGARRRDTRIEFLNEAQLVCPLGGVMSVLAGVATALASPSSPAGPSSSIRPRPC